MASQLLTVSALSARGVRHFFGTRREPRFSPEPPAGRLIGHPLPEPPMAVVTVKQVHGTDILVLTEPVGEPGRRFWESSDRGWDALVTNQPGVLLTVRTADCVPVLIHDPTRGVVAAIHAGWRGTVAGIVPKTVATLHREFGSSPDALCIGIGPSIGPCCYEVDEPVLERVRHTGVRWQAAVVPRGAGKATLDLRALITAQASDAGVSPEAIASASLCTACEPDLFYSYRRDRQVLGTMVSGIVLVGAQA